MATPTTKLVPIRTVCAVYQLNANTLRTWERRYKIIEPNRSVGGHRGYSEADIMSIELMLKLLKEGNSPAEAAYQIKQQIIVPKPEVSNDRQQMLASALKEADMRAVINIIQDSNRVHGYAATVEEFLFHELSELGVLWETEIEVISREHFLSLAVKTFILEQQRKLTPFATGPAVLLACVPGEDHDLPTLHVTNLLLETQRVTPVALTAGLPIKSILATAKSINTQALVLSSSVTPRPDVLRLWINEIINSGWESRTILAGGGFQRSRVFSESKIRSAPGNYQQTVRLIIDMVATSGT